ncbi:MAG: Tail-specific protease precursor [Deltaproteobacteria bacterium ADurb.Bin510]|nr:MAG: Tail-specific protease precursor [Deltaproteobacteria bacterium ADurb.Bin510]
MNALTTCYDPHTQYFSPRTSENFKINMSLSLEGIGAMLEPDFEYTKIVRLIPGGPAARAGSLKPGDRIVGVGQGPQGKIVDVVGWRLDDVVDQIRGPKGSTVRLEIVPADQTDTHQTRFVTLERDTIKLEEQAAKKKIMTVKRGGLNHRIGIIDLPAFYSDFDGMRAGKSDFRSTTRDVKRLVEELKLAQVEAIIIDLRDNGGGSLPEVNALIGLFIDRGPTVLVRSTGGRIDVQSDPAAGTVYDGPLAVVVNRLSASASEIFAGAIQDYGRGLVIGQQTYGKGTVQALIDLMGDKDTYGQIKLTQAKFYRISGESTQDRGVTPDIELPSLIDTKTIGESVVPGALPWDKIYGINHRSYGDFKPYLPELKKRHQGRMNHDADYVYLNASLKLIDEVREQKVVSLNEAQRLKEQARLKSRRLAIENARRQAKHEAPLKDLDDEDKDEPEIKDTPPEEDFILMESGQIMLDLIEMLKPDMQLRKAG